MRAVVFDQVQGRPDVREVPAPAVTPGGVVVKVMATGLCRSDWHAWAGHEDIAFPHVPGHELAGIVTEVGADVVAIARVVHHDEENRLLTERQVLSVALAPLLDA